MNSLNESAPRRQTLLRSWKARVGGFGLLLLCVLVVVILTGSRTGTIPYRGRVVVVPLRTGSFRTMVSEGRARFIQPGPPDIKPLLDERAGDLGFRFNEQLGAMYSIVSTRGDGVRVVLVTEAVASQFVQVDCYVQEDAPSTQPEPAKTAGAR